jgi:hypothetical protein
LYIKTSLYFIILLFWFDISVNKLLINSFDCSIGTVLFLETMPPKPCFGDKMVKQNKCVFRFLAFSGIEALVEFSTTSLKFYQLR